jgi:hypothetical protein
VKKSFTFFLLFLFLCITGVTLAQEVPQAKEDIRFFTYEEKINAILQYPHLLEDSALSTEYPEEYEAAMKEQKSLVYDYPDPFERLIQRNPENVARLKEQFMQYMQTKGITFTELKGIFSYNPLENMLTNTGSKGTTRMDMVAALELPGKWRLEGDGSIALLQERKEPLILQGLITIKDGGVVTIQKGEINIHEIILSTEKGTIIFKITDESMTIDGNARINGLQLSNVRDITMHKNEGSISGKTGQNTNLLGLQINEKGIPFIIKEGTLTIQEETTVNAITLEDETMELNAEFPVTLPGEITLQKGMLKIQREGPSRYILPKEKTTTLNGISLQTLNKDLIVNEDLMVNEERGTQKEKQGALKRPEEILANSITFKEKSIMATGPLEIINGNAMYTFNGKNIFKKKGKEKKKQLNKIIFVKENNFYTIAQEEKEIRLKKNGEEKISITKSEGPQPQRIEKTDYTKANARLPYGKEHLFNTFPIHKYLLEGNDPEAITKEDIQYYLIAEHLKNGKTYHQTLSETEFANLAGRAASKVTEGQTTTYIIYEELQLKKITVKDYWNDETLHPDGTYTQVDCELNLINCNLFSNPLD